jgi:hypothetical protein
MEDKEFIDKIHKSTLYKEYKKIKKKLKQKKKQKRFIFVYQKKWFTKNCFRDTALNYDYILTAFIDGMGVTKDLLEKHGKNELSDDDLKEILFVCFFLYDRDLKNNKNDNDKDKDKDKDSEEEEEELDDPINFNSFTWNMI